jgi:hypothetical protein
LKTWRIRQPRAQQPRPRRNCACPLSASLVALRCDQSLQRTPGMRSPRHRDLWTLSTKPCRPAALLFKTSSPCFIARPSLATWVWVAQLAASSSSRFPHFGVPPYPRAVSLWLTDRPKRAELPPNLFHNDRARHSMFGRMLYALAMDLPASVTLGHRKHREPSRSLRTE